MSRLRRLAPFALLAGYALLVFLAATPEFDLDERRYARLAENLTHGFFSPSGVVSLPSPPGYPLLLTPVAALGLPWLVGKLLNALLLFGAILHFHLAVARFTSARTAWAASAALALYAPFFRYLPLLMSETLAVFLVAGFIDHATALWRAEGRAARVPLGLAALYLAGLALTKSMYGYTTLAMMALLAPFAWRSQRVRRLLVCHALALALCLPYLAYTYRLTGRVFYWQTTGGPNLYWMSSPYSEEFGDYVANDYSGLMGRRWEIEDCADRMRARHGAFLREISTLRQDEMDSRFRRQALANVKAHPLRYARNWVLNVGRLLLNFPFSCSAQHPRTYLYVVFNGPVVLLVLLAGWLTLTQRVPQPPPEIQPLLLFAAVAFAAWSIPSAQHRHFAPLVPILALWIAFALDRVLPRVPRGAATLPEPS